MSNSSLFTVSTGRVILFILALLLVIIRFTQPTANSANLAGQVISLFTVLYCISIFTTSYIYPYFRDNLYFFVLGAFVLFAFGFLNQIFITAFSKSVLSGFVVYSLVAAFYIRRISHLGLFQLFMISTVTMIFFLLPDPSPEAKSFLFRFSGVQLLAFFILSSRIRSLDRLVTQDLRYESLIESLFCGVIQIDQTGKITMVNAQICRLTGLEKDLLVNKLSFQDLVLPDDYALAESKISTLLAGQPEKLEIRLRRKTGEPFWVKISASPSINPENEISGISMVLADISSEKTENDQMVSHIRDMEMTNHELIRQKNNLETMVRKTTEEMRVPAESVHRISETLKTVNGDENPMVSSWLNEISNHTHQLLEKIEGMWMFVVSEVEKPILEEVDTMAVIADIRNNIAFRLKENHATIIAKELPNIRADRMQITRLFSNLIENALRHRGAEPPVIQIGASVNDDKEEFNFSVVDNGLGLNREENERVFSLFRKEYENDMKGIGMGLHICKKIVLNHGGRMWFTSNSGKGTSFFFSIPWTGQTIENKLPAEQPEPPVENP
ncbi:MAG: ATP-binding protein [Bacteroidia bacterium]